MRQRRLRAPFLQHRSVPWARLPNFQPERPARAGQCAALEVPVIERVTVNISDKRPAAQAGLAKRIKINSLSAQAGLAWLRKVSKLSLTGILGAAKHRPVLV